MPKSSTFDFFKAKLDDVKESLDTRILLVVVFFCLCWFVIDILLFKSDFNTLVSVFLFGGMIFASLGLIDFAGIKADYREPFEWSKIFMGVLIALAGVYASSIVIAIISGQFQNTANLVSLFKIYTFSLPSGTQASNNPVVLYFFNVSNGFSLNPNFVVNALTNMFLVSPAEELTFRAVGTLAISRGLEVLTKGDVEGGVLVGGLISNGLWASLHSIVAYTGPMALINVLTAYIGGIWFLIAMLYSKNVWTSMIAHTIYNCVIVLATIPIWA